MPPFRAVPPALALLLMLLAAGCTTIQYGGRHGLAVEAKTETTGETSATFRPDRSLGVEAELYRGKVNALLGPDEKLVYPSFLKDTDDSNRVGVSHTWKGLDLEEPLPDVRVEKLEQFKQRHAKPSLGYQFGLFGGYSHIGQGGYYDDGRIEINNITRFGASAALIGSDSAVYEFESWGVEMTVKGGVAFVNRWVKVADDLVEGTVAPYSVIAPGITVRTPLRFGPDDGKYDYIVTLGMEGGFYGGEEAFSTVGLTLGIVLHNRHAEGDGIVF